MTSASDAAALSPTALHERLDHAGLLDAAHGSGCYALEIDVPDCVETATRQWLATFDATPGDAAIERLANAEHVAYVGASGNVYERVMDHAKGEKRKAAVLRAFVPTDVVGVWAESEPFEAERSRAMALAADGWACWVNGEVCEG